MEAWLPWKELRRNQQTRDARREKDESTLSISSDNEVVTIGTIEPQNIKNDHPFR